MADATVEPTTSVHSINGTKPVDDTQSFKSGSETFELTFKELAQIPYLDALRSGNFKENPDEGGTISINPSICDPAILKAVVLYIKTGRARRLFSALPDSANSSDIFKLLDYLGVAKPTMTLAEIDKALKNVTTMYDRQGCGSTANRSAARDACVKLCWIGVDLVQDHKEQTKVDNMVLYIMSHPRTFYWNLRRLTLDWYSTRFTPTPKQLSILQKWFSEVDFRFPHSVDSGESSSGGSSGSDDYYGYGGYSS